MTTGRIRRLGQFCWQDADVGVECLSCGRVRVFCDWEIERSFHGRGWSTDLDSATRHLRCPCGSGEVRLRPVPIWKRPCPLPIRPRALRPVYTEHARLLRRRGRIQHPDADRIERALAVLAAAVAAYPARPDGTAIGGAVEELRPLVYHQHFLDELIKGLGSSPSLITTRQQVDHPYGHVLRQLGRARP